MRTAAVCRPVKRSQRPTRLRPLPARRAVQRGASALMFLVSLAVTLGGLLAAVDLARIQLAQGRLQSSLDSAVQSAARRFGTAPNAAWETEIRAWMQANHDSQFTLSVQPGRERLSAMALSSLRLLSAGFLPFDATTATVQASSGTFLSNLRRLEVVVALDASASPEAWLGLLDARARVSRQAAWDLIRGLLPETPDPNIRVGLVPFADTVKIAEPGRVSSAAVRTWMNSYWHLWLDTWGNASVNSRNPWTGCVSERGLFVAGTGTPSQQDLIAGPGKPGSLAPLFLPYGFQLTPMSRFDWRLTPGSAPTARPGYAVAASIAATRQLNIWASLPAPNCSQVPAMTYLTSDRTAFESTFNRLLALPTTGNDAGLLPLGPLWAWRMLTPAWRNGIWTDAGNTTSETDKVIVLVTSGLNRPQKTSPAYSGPSFGIPFAVDYNYQNCLWIFTCLYYDSTSQSARFSSDGATGSPIVNATGSVSTSANTLTSLNAYGSTLYTGAEQSQSSHLDQYTRALCRQISGTDIKLYTLVVQPRYLREVTLPCAVPEQRETQLISWSSSDRLAQEAGDLATRILEAYRNSQ